MVTKQHLLDIEELETWIERERIKIHNEFNKIHQARAKNTADNSEYLVNVLTSAFDRLTAALAVLERLEAWIEKVR